MASPLTGIKVLDLTRILAGPWSTMTLADLGATVWKIENPDGGDDSRAWTPPSICEVSTYFLTANRNKQSIAIDMRHPEGRALVLALAEQADVVVENFLPDSLKRLGLTYDDLKAVNPRLIHCSISGYGRNNPMENRPGYDFVIQAESGFMSITGEPAGQPMRLGVAFIDLITGMNCTQAILAALLERERSGLGQSIDIALSDSAMQFLANISTGYLNTDKVPGRHGNAHPSIAPYQLFNIGNGLIALAVGNDAQYRRLCLDVLQAPQLCEDERFRSNDSRARNRPALVECLQAEFSRWSKAELLAALHKASIPVGEVQNVEQAFNGEVARTRDLVMSVEHPQAGTVKLVRSPLRFSRTPVVAPKAPPLVGQHSEEVLRTVLGLAPAQIQRLKEIRCIG